MIKFVHRKHTNQNQKTDKIVIYYSLLDIILGLLLMVLVAFFIYNYLEFKVFSPSQNGAYFPMYGVVRPNKLPINKQ